MRAQIAVLVCCLFIGCNNAGTTTQVVPEIKIRPQPFAENSWQYFLQHLPVINAPVKYYNGNPVEGQRKHFAVINYDVGNKDLQQCADALMRLRAEYLFKEQKAGSIGFHFLSGQFYSFDIYCKGVRPVLRNNALVFKTGAAACPPAHAALRKYLDIVYTYANTISLSKELLPASKFEVGTVIITPGSPGHTCIIIDEKLDDKGEKLFMLAEGYMPAQSIYILSNPYDESISPWYKLNKGDITTASYHFTEYQLRKFE